MKNNTISESKNIEFENLNKDDFLKNYYSENINYTYTKKNDINNNNNSDKKYIPIKKIKKHKLFHKRTNSLKPIIPNEILLNKERCHKLNQDMIKKVKKNISLNLDEFFTKKRHFLIMTDGGKPVYSRYGDAVNNNSIFATVSAMITKFTIFNSTHNYKEDLNIISNNKNKIVFVKKGQLFFIAISKKSDSISLLNSQLEYLYNQLMSILTVKFYEKLENNPSKCLTAMSDTENLFEQIIKYSSNSFVSLFNSYHVMSYISHRKKLNKLVEEYRGDALYCIIMTPYEIISLAHSNVINVVPSDLVLIQTLIYCTEMLRTQVSYVPICLPGVSDQGYIQLYSQFTQENIGIIFITENIDSNHFSKFQKQFTNLYQKLTENGFIEKIIDSMMYNNNITKKKTLMNNNNNNNDEIKSPLFKSIYKINSVEIKDKNGKDGKIKRKTDRSLTTKFPNAKREELILGTIKYGVVLNKKLNQYFLINFDMDFRVLNKAEKLLIKKYNLLFDIYNCDEKNKEKKEYFFIDRREDYINVILVDENYLSICSYEFELSIDGALSNSYDFHKYLNKKDYKYFILFK